MKKALLALILAFTITLSGCSAAWVSTLDAILSAAAPALINILEIIAVAKGESANGTLVNKINTDATNIKQLAGDFANASSASAPGVCAQLKAAIGVYQQDQQIVLQTAQVSDPNTQLKLELLSNLVSGTAAVVLSVIPQCNAPAPTKAAATAPLSVKNFVNDYNAILTAKTGNLAVDAFTPTRKLHQHSKFWRVVSLGLLK